jgi:hypothetical protein
MPAHGAFSEAKRFPQGRARPRVQPTPGSPQRARVARIAIPVPAVARDLVSAGAWQIALNRIEEVARTNRVAGSTCHASRDAVTTSPLAIALAMSIAGRQSAAVGLETPGWTAGSTLLMAAPRVPFCPSMRLARPSTALIDSLTELRKSGATRSPSNPAGRDLLAHVAQLVVTRVVECLLHGRQLSLVGDPGEGGAREAVGGAIAPEDAIALVGEDALQRKAHGDELDELICRQPVGGEESLPDLLNR